MQALELSAYDERPASLQLVQKPVPQPSQGEVLVRIAATSINPSDLMFLRGDYGVRKRLPVVPGFEGSGVVVRSGGGFPARALVGWRVACAAPDNGDGTWAEYMVTQWNRCAPLRKKTSLEQGASLLVNPLTAFALMEIAARGRHHAIAQTAAASSLGRMIVHLGRRFGIAVINIVRRQEHVEILKSQGAECVLNSSEPGFDERLQEACHQFRATLGFDAVGGEITGQLVHAMPRSSCVLVFGALAKKDCSISPSDFIFDGKRVDGFWLAEWFPRQSLVYQLKTAFRVQDFLQTDLKTEIRERLPLTAGPKAIEDYASRMTDRKILFIPDQNENA
jgi:NADPH2:quinone reductase